MLGQNIMPVGYDPIADAMDDRRILVAMAKMRANYAAQAERMPPHAGYINSHCPAYSGNSIPLR
jgi:tryptophan halogenase